MTTRYDIGTIVGERKITGITVNKSRVMYQMDHGAPLTEDEVTEQIESFAKRMKVMDKPVFLWEDFKAGKVAVHCDTEEKAKAFCAECDKHGIKWRSGASLAKNTFWDNYKEKTIYDRKYGGFGYADIGGFFAESTHIPIIDYPFAQPRMEPKPHEFKPGDKARCVAAHGHFFTAGKIYEADSEGGVRDDLDGGFSGTESERTGFDWLNKHSNYRFEPVEDKPTEPVKLYCVKDDRDWLKAGKVYTIGKNGSFYGEHELSGFHYKTASDVLKGNRSWVGYLFPLVKRPVEVDEYVYILKSQFPECCPANHIYKVVGIEGDRIYVSGKKDAGRGEIGWCFFDNEYLVLDGYHPDEPKPETSMSQRCQKCYESHIAAFSRASKYERMSNSELKDAVCDRGVCSAESSFRKHDCPLKRSGYGNCLNYLEAHASELRPKLIEYLTNEDTGV